MLHDKLAGKWKYIDVLIFNLSNCDKVIFQQHGMMTIRYISQFDYTWLAMCQNISVMELLLQQTDHKG